MANSHIPVFVISLISDVKRRAKIKRQLDKLQIPFEFFDAVDAREGLDHLDATQVDLDPSLHLSLPEYGCSLSHASLYQKMVDESIDYALIMEDDAIVLPNITRFLRLRCYEKAPFMMLYHGRAYVDRHFSIPLFDNYVARKLRLNSAYAVAYTLSLEAAKAMNEAARPVNTIPDWPTDIAELGAHIVRPVLVQHPPYEQGSGLAALRRRKPKSLKRYLDRKHYRRKWIRRTSERIEPTLLDSKEITQI